MLFRSYSFGAALSAYTKKGNKWVFGGEYLLKNNPYTVSYTHLPVVTIIIMEAFINKMRRLKGVRKQLIVEAVSYTHLVIDDIAS